MCVMRTCPKVSIAIPYKTAPCVCFQKQRSRELRRLLQERCVLAGVMQYRLEHMCLVGLLSTYDALANLKEPTCRRVARPLVVQHGPDVVPTAAPGPAGADGGAKY